MFFENIIFLEMSDGVLGLLSSSQLPAVWHFWVQRSERRYVKYEN